MNKYYLVVTIDDSNSADVNLCECDLIPIDCDYISRPIGGDDYYFGYVFVFMSMERTEEFLKNLSEIYFATRDMEVLPSKIGVKEIKEKIREVILEWKEKER